MTPLCEGSTIKSQRDPVALTTSVVFISILALLHSSCSRSTPGKTTGEPPRSAAVKVKVVGVERQEQRRTVEAVGSLFAYDEVVVSSEVEGRVEEVMADVG